MLTLVSNPRRRRRKARRRNPDGSFASAGGSTASNPKRRRRNPDGGFAGAASSTASNPTRRRSGRRRRNPFGIEQASEQAFGITPQQMLGGGAGVLLSEIIGAEIDKMVNPATNPLPVVPLDKIDLMYALRKAGPRGLAAVGLYMGAKLLKLKKDEQEAVAIGGASSFLLQFVGALHVWPDVIKDGSLVIGGGPRFHALPPPRDLGADNTRAPAAVISSAMP